MGGGEAASENTSAQATSAGVARSECPHSPPLHTTRPERRRRRTQTGQEVRFPRGREARDREIRVSSHARRRRLWAHSGPAFPRLPEALPEGDPDASSSLSLPRLRLRYCIFCVLPHSADSRRCGKAAFSLGRWAEPGATRGDDESWGTVRREGGQGLRGGPSRKPQPLRRRCPSGNEDWIPAEPGSTCPFCWRGVVRLSERLTAAGNAPLFDERGVRQLGADVGS